MKYIFLKLIISSGIITIVSEISKKSSFIGGLVASIPLISVLSMIWLYIDSRDIEKIKNLSTSIFWMVIPSLVLFLSIPILINIGFNFGTFSKVLSASTIPPKKTSLEHAPPSPASHTHAYNLA